MTWFMDIIKGKLAPIRQTRWGRKPLLCDCGICVNGSVDLVRPCGKPTLSFHSPFWVVMGSRVLGPETFCPRAGFLKSPKYHLHLGKRKQCFRISCMGLLLSHTICQRHIGTINSLRVASKNLLSSAIKGNYCIICLCL